MGGGNLLCLPIPLEEKFFGRNITFMHDLTFSFLVARCVLEKKIYFLKLKLTCRGGRMEAIWLKKWSQTNYIHRENVFFTQSKAQWVHQKPNKKQVLINMDV
uniref:Uncharacterized protein n=1 Tax=Cacopsylla melanoneura TaxID=428564 RepID=A0A8D9E8F7_9HEMI